MSATMLVVFVEPTYIEVENSDGLSFTDFVKVVEEVGRRLRIKGYLILKVTYHFAC